MMVLQPQQSNFTESVKKKRRIQLDESNLVNPEEDVSGGVGELGAPKPSSEEEYLTHKSLRWYISLGDFKTQVSMKRLLELDGSDMPRKKKKRKAEINDGEDVEVSNDEIEEEDGEENDESDSHGSYYDVDDPFIDDSGIIDADDALLMQTDVGGFFIHDGTAEVRVKRIEKEPDNSKKKKKKRTKKHEKVRENDDVAEIESDVVSNSHQASKNDHSPSKIEKASTFEFSPALKVVFDHLESKAKSILELEGKTNFAKFPPELDEDLLIIQRVCCLQVELKDRKNLYEELSKVLGITSKSIRSRMLTMFDEWKYDKIFDVQKKVTKRLKNRITREYKKATAPPAENEEDVKHNVVPGGNTSSNVQMFQIKWEIYVEDIIRLIEYAELRQKIKLSIEKKKYKKAAEPEVLESAEAVVINNVVDYFPAEAKVTAQQILDAVRNYSEKYSRSSDLVEFEIETEKFQNGEEEILCTITHPGSSLKKEKEKEKPKQIKQASTPNVSGLTKAVEIGKPQENPKVVVSKIVSIAPSTVTLASIVSTPSRPKCLDRTAPVLPPLPPGYEWIPQTSTTFDQP